MLAYSSSEHLYWRMLKFFTNNEMQFTSNTKHTYVHTAIHNRAHKASAPHNHLPEPAAFSNTSQNSSSNRPSSWYSGSAGSSHMPTRYDFVHTVQLERKWRALVSGFPTQENKTHNAQLCRDPLLWGYIDRHLTKSCQYARVRGAWKRECCAKQPPFHRILRVGGGIATTG